MNWDMIGGIGLFVLTTGFIIGFFISLGNETGIHSFTKRFLYGLVTFLTLVSVFPILPIMFGAMAAAMTGSDLFGGFAGVLSWPTLAVGGFLLADWMEDTG